MKQVNANAYQMSWAKNVTDARVAFGKLHPGKDANLVLAVLLVLQTRDVTSSLDNVCVDPLMEAEPAQNAKTTIGVTHC